MKKILIGTHNAGKFKEIAYLISKKYKKISPISLKIQSPKETGKSFISNSKLKVKFFSHYVNYPVISDDSGLCIQALNNKPGIYSARLAKRYGSFLNAMKFILKKMKNKKNRKATFVCSLSYINNGKIVSAEGRLKGNISFKIKGKTICIKNSFLFFVFTIIFNSLGSKVNATGLTNFFCLTSSNL